MNAIDRSAGPSAMLSEFAAQVGYDDLPADVVAHAKTHLLDTIGVCLGGVSTNHVAIVAGLIRDSERTFGATVIGHDFRAGLDDAVFANAVMGHSIDFDDGHKFIHPGCVVVPVVLGLAEMRRATGQDLITALALGYDISVRVSLAGGPAHRNRGFHPTGTCNVFGAAAAACRLTGASARVQHSAMGIAASHACSITQYRSNGAPTKHLHAGFAARGALLSARLAEAGLPGPLEPLEGEFGFLKVYSDGFDPVPLTADLGSRFMIAETDIKPYPSCRQTHAPVDLALKAVHRHGIRPEQIASASLHTYRYAAEKPWMTTSAPPVSSLAAMLSIPFCVASTIVDGRLILSSFDADPLEDPKKLELSRRITVVNDDNLTARWPDERGARLELKLTDGRELTLTASNPRGGTAAPLSYAEIVEKFLSMAEPVIGACARDFVAQVEQIEDQKDVSEIVSLLRRNNAAAPATAMSA